MPVADLNRTYPREVVLNNNAIQFRLMTSSDRDTMLAFARSLDPEDLLFLRMDITDPEAIDQWVQTIESGRRVTVLAELNGEVIGYGSLNRRELYWSRHIGEIRIIVHLYYRHMGLGRELAKEVFAIAREMDLQKIVAQMPADEPGGRKMFESIGFKREGLLTDWVIDADGQTHDLIVMSCDVSGAPEA